MGKKKNLDRWRASLTISLPLFARLSIPLPFSLSCTYHAKLRSFSGSILYWLEILSGGGSTHFLRCMKTSNGEPCDTSTNMDGDLITITGAENIIDFVLFQGYFYVNVANVNFDPFMLNLGLKRFQEMAGASGEDLSPTSGASIYFLAVQPAAGVGPGKIFNHICPRLKLLYIVSADTDCSVYDRKMTSV